MSNAPILWAQRSSEDDADKNVLLLTIEAPELEEGYTLDFPEDGSKLVFKGKSKAYPSAGHTEQAKEYALDLELFDKVLPDKVKSSLSGKNLNLVIPKKELKSEYWPRLTKDKKKQPWIKTDFERWVDEDEQDAQEDLDQGTGGMPGGGGGMDMASMMQGMGGMGGMGGMMGGGGAPGAGGMDMEAMLAQLKAQNGGNMPDFGDDDDGDMPALEEEGDSTGDAKGKGKAVLADDDDDAPPPLESA